MTETPPDPRDHEADVPYGRCDWCGEPIDMDEGEQLSMSVFEGVHYDVEGNPLSSPISAQEAANGVADALERIGGVKDKLLAKTIRAEQRYRLHTECYEASALTQLYTET